MRPGCWERSSPITQCLQTANAQYFSTLFIPGIIVLCKSREFHCYTDLPQDEGSKCQQPSRTNLLFLNLFLIRTHFQYWSGVLARIEAIFILVHGGRVPRPPSPGEEAPPRGERSEAHPWVPVGGERKGIWREAQCPSLWVPPAWLPWALIHCIGSNPKGRVLFQETLSKDMPSEVSSLHLRLIAQESSDYCS